MKKRMVLLLTLSLLLLPQIVLAQDIVEPQPLPEFLDLLAGPTGWIVVGTLASMALATWPWYQAQLSAVKKALPVVIAVVVAIGARLLLVYVPAAVWAVLAPYWYIIAGATVTWLSSQAWYQLAVKRRSPRTFMILGDESEQ